jgi:hypothetical protein
VALRDPHLRSSPHSDAENERLVGDTEVLSEAYLEQEDELIQSHRKEIEVSMNAVRQEMSLLGRVRFVELLFLVFVVTAAEASIAELLWLFFVLPSPGAGISHGDDM